MNPNLIDIIQPNWPINPSIVHAATTCRSRGHSKFPFDSLNLSHNVGDDEEHVMRNREKVISQLGCPNQPVWLRQTHSNKVVHADRYTDAEEADASFTQTPGMVLSILTADCMPIILFHPKPHTLAIIHAGWQGMSNGIIANTIANMPKPHNQIYAWLGPCISEDVYETGHACIDQWTRNDPSLAPALIAKNQKIYASLVSAATLILHRFNIIQIYPSEYCTYQMAYSFFSHRRDHGRTGRVGTFAWLPPQSEQRPIQK